MLVPTIGIEVHVELKSCSKVFSGSKNSFQDPVNTNVSLVDLGYPGTLPTINREVVRMAMMASLAFHCQIHQVMHFDRKNYFYPDLPKGYQITQSKTPIGYDGYVTIEVDGKEKQIGLERIHIEEDTCKSVHTDSLTLLNFNRAGVPLIEIVTKPVIESAAEAMLYVEKLRETLLYLGISDVKIEEGSMRCDVNVSLHEEGEPFGTKTEIKNIGSIRNVGVSIAYEIERQKKILEAGGVIQEETRRFDDKTMTTVLMRVKETGNDYRYFPEPDLPFLVVSDEWIQEVKQDMPVMPTVLKERYQAIGLNENHIKTIIANREMCECFEALRQDMNPVILANLLTGDMTRIMNQNNLTFTDISFIKELVKQFVDELEKKTISSKQGKDILPHLLLEKKTIEQVKKELGMVQINDEEALLEIVKTVLQENQESIQDYLAGKDRAIKYLMGQIMKASKGSANPVSVNQILLSELKNINLRNLIFYSIIRANEVIL